jgi:hypothetical protein
MEDAMKVRQRVMELLLLMNEKTYYSYRMDNLIVLIYCVTLSINEGVITLFFNKCA